MEQAVITQLNIIRMSGTKPNFSELARMYGYDRKTIKKYYDGYEGKPKHRSKSSALDEHYDLIKNKLAIKGTNIMAVYQFIVDKYGEDICTYSNFRKYVKSKGLKPVKTMKNSLMYTLI